MLRSALLLVAPLAAALSAASCRHVSEQAASVTPWVARVDASPQAALLAIRHAAIDGGFRIEDEGPDHLVVDFGVAPALLPSEGGGAPRRTEVHGSGLYTVRPAATGGGSEITLLAAVTAWEPDLRAWLPADGSLSPGPSLLSASAR